jgi:uncharacterized coiled-coil protein SlyX
MLIDPETTQGAGIAGWGIAGTGVIALIVAIIRKTVRSISSDSVGVKQDTAQKDTLDQMNSEIARLESLVMRMGSRMSAMEERLAEACRALLKAQMTLIEVERETLGCDRACDNSMNVRVKLNEAQDLLSRASQEAARPITVEEVSA